MQKEQRLEICEKARSMIQLFPTSKFALEFLAKDYIHSLVGARK